MAEGGGHRCPGAPDTHVLGTITEPPIEPSLLPPPSQHLMSSPDPRGGGELCYPKSLTPAQRQALHGRLAVLTQDQAQQILDELSGRLVIAQVRNPLRYCAVLIRRLQRGKFAPELGLTVASATPTPKSSVLPCSPGSRAPLRSNRVPTKAPFRRGNATQSDAFTQCRVRVRERASNSAHIQSITMSAPEILLTITEACGDFAPAPRDLARHGRSGRVCRHSSSDAPGTSWKLT